MTRQPVGHTASASASLAAAFDALGEAAATLDALLPRLDDQQRSEVVARVGDIGRGADALKLRIAGDVVHRHDDLPKDERFTVACGYRDPADMLTVEFGASRSSIRRLLRAVAVLRPTVGLTGAAIPARFPVLGSAVADGAVTIEQAGAIVDALGDAPDRSDPEHVEAAERALVAAAVGEHHRNPGQTETAGPAMPPELLAKVARRWRDGMDPDGVEPRYEDQLRQRSFTFSTRADGLVVGKLLATPDQGAVLAAAFDAFTNPRAPRFLTDEERAQAELETDDRTRGQKMVDALIAMVRGAVEQGFVPRVAGERPTVVLHISEATYRAAVSGDPGCTAVDERTGELVPITVAAALMCDGRIQAVVTGADGLPLYLGRTERLFSRAQRRALAARDKSCRAPGCTAPVGWCEAHHITPWSLGGTTDVDNGILLCTHHHHEVHRGMLEVIKGPGGWFVRARIRPPRRRRGWPDSLDPATFSLQPVA
ncbi:HNH endonuclease signature motif containing protein [Agrococcus sp. ARC_14]|uniref:HNH endonuclease signature motif containing protein n=1 Tax=Agrococcus sp. ARC_14 TaxID=2919927 RepID=UPI001F0519E5|nr:HNH endonuclease signature motif containing protein [Agrococcus sp. ARC_14]MCH1884315.1 HNH endonuclease [Agrococcus sp. ARC_14]